MSALAAALAQLRSIARPFSNYPSKVDLVLWIHLLAFVHDVCQYDDTQIRAGRAPSATRLPHRLTFSKLQRATSICATLPDNAVVDSASRLLRLSSSGMPELPWTVAPVVLLDQRISHRNATEKSTPHVALFALALLDEVSTGDGITGHRAAELTVAAVHVLIGLARQVCKIEPSAKHSFNRAVARIHAEAGDLVRVQTSVQTMKKKEFYTRQQWATISAGRQVTPDLLTSMGISRPFAASSVLTAGSVRCILQDISVNASTT